VRRRCLQGAPEASGVTTTLRLPQPTHSVSWSCLFRATKTAVAIWRAASSCAPAARSRLPRQPAIMSTRAPVRSSQPATSSAAAAPASRLSQRQQRPAELRGRDGGLPAPVAPRRIDQDDRVGQPDAGPGPVPELGRGQLVQDRAVKFAPPRVRDRPVFLPEPAREHQVHRQAGAQRRDCRDRVHAGLAAREHAESGCLPQPCPERGQGRAPGRVVRTLSRVVLTGRVRAPWFWLGRGAICPRRRPTRRQSSPRSPRSSPR